MLKEYKCLQNTIMSTNKVNIIVHKIQDQLNILLQEKKFIKTKARLINILNDQILSRLKKFVRGHLKYELSPTSPLHPKYEIELRKKRNFILHVWKHDTATKFNFD